MKLFYIIGFVRSEFLQTVDCSFKGVVLCIPCAPCTSWKWGKHQKMLKILRVFTIFWLFSTPKIAFYIIICVGNYAPAQFPKPFCICSSFYQQDMLDQETVMFFSRTSHYNLHNFIKFQNLWFAEDLLFEVETFIFFRYFYKIFDGLP